MHSVGWWWWQPSAPPRWGPGIAAWHFLHRQACQRLRAERVDNGGCHNVCGWDTEHWNLQQWRLRLGRHLAGRHDGRGLVATPPSQPARQPGLPAACIMLVRLIGMLVTAAHE
jgi:hypothetical protein